LPDKYGIADIYWCSKGRKVYSFSGMLGVINYSPIKLFDNTKNSAKTLENKI